MAEGIRRDWAAYAADVSDLDPREFKYRLHHFTITLGEQAAVCYEHALEMSRGVGDRYYEADVLSHLGDTHEAAGDTVTARAAWLRAHTILDQLGHSDADQLAVKLQLASTAARCWTAN
jgi:hypothetical protein